MLGRQRTPAVKSVICILILNTLQYAYCPKLKHFLPPPPPKILKIFKCLIGQALLFSSFDPPHALNPINQLLHPHPQLVYHIHSTAFDFCRALA